MAHAAFSPSAAHRWMACPASWKAEQPYPDETSRFAAEGSAAHYVAQMALEGLGEPEDFIGHDVTEDGFTFTVDREMAEYVQVYINYCRWLVLSADWYAVEVKCRFQPELDVLKDCWGTADFVARIGDVLHVVDLKYGRGVEVEAKDNPQLMIYAAACIKPDNPEGIGSQTVEEVVTTIVQPRVSSEPKSASYTRDTILRFMEDKLIPAVLACQAPNPPFVAGDHCRFCKFRNECAAYKGKALAVAQEEFAELPVASLTVAQMARAMAKAELLSLWLDSIRAHLTSLMEQGQAVPGYKLVAKRGQREWSTEDQKAIIRALRKVVPDVKPKAFYEQRFMSVAQAEKIVGKAGLPAKLVTSVSSGFTLAPEGDKRQAVEFKAAKDEFQPVANTQPEGQ